MQSRRVDIGCEKFGQFTAGSLAVSSREETTGPPFDDFEGESFARVLLRIRYISYGCRLPHATSITSM